MLGSLRESVGSFSESFTDPLIFLTCFRTSFWFPSKVEDDGDAEVEDEP